MPEFAEKLFNDVQKHFKAQYDTSGAIGRRYRRQDEIGTPFCLTVDGESLTEGTVTIRERDTMTQERIPAENAVLYIQSKLLAK